MTADSIPASGILRPSKKERRPPLWLAFIAFSYVALLSLIPYIVIWGPSDVLGLKASFADQKMVLRSVEPGTVPARTGLLAGDQVLAIDGRPMKSTQDWSVMNANLEVGRVQQWEILRDGKRIELEIRIERADWRNRLAAGYFSYAALAFCGLAVGLLMVLRRPRDPATRMGAWFIGTASIAFGLPNGWAAVWRQAPVLFQVVFWIPELSRFVLEAIFLSLLMVFPRRLTRARWPWLLVWAPVLVTLPWRVVQFYAAIYNPSEGGGLPVWMYQLTMFRIMVYLVAGIGILFVSYFYLLEADEKRRVRILLVGIGISITAATLIVWHFSVVGFGMSGDLISDFIWILLVHPLTLAAPLAFAYAIVRHRVFDIRVIIRQGLQYAFARGAVLGLVPAVGAVLVLDLALNRNQPLAVIFRNHGWLYFAVSCVAVVLYWQRDRWLEGIDRRFFREHYDAQQVLREVAQEIRSAPGIEQIARRVASRIEAALHPEFVSLLVQEPGESDFRPLVSVPPGRQFSLAADSKLVGLARVLGRPFEVLLGQSDWLEQRLPLEEIDLARSTGIDLLIPVSTSPGGRQALLVLGIRRSEEPYAQKDQELLETVAANLALLLEQPSVALELSQPLSVAEVAFSEGHEVVGFEATEELPQELMPNRGTKGTSRYRVVRSLGEGGMGEVFLAEDISLERKVALKFLSKALQGDRIARQRFLREAKSAAALDHPFICKIYETGQTENGRAFIAMEYVEGQTLKEKMAGGGLSLEQALQIAIQVTNALEIAHKRGIIHRDLKPANIMITEQGHAKVMDFGLAKRLTEEDSSEQDLSLSLTQDGITVGTPAYMSPEQIKAQTVDHRSDIFSFGIVLYEMLTGFHPFRRDRALETMAAILNDDEPPLSEHLSSSTNLLQETIGRMLAKDPSRRYATTTELAKDLIRCGAEI